METVLKIENLTKKFNKRVILDNISLDAYAGEVFGFLGPNGAGKTTTIKIITGLLDADGGKVEINGFDVGKRFEKAMENIGAIVENPELYGYMSGLRNLRQFKRLRNGVTEERLMETVRFVGLENRIKDKVKRYSLGMKQRLGVAQAILHRPRLLVLDEPTNGLDPAGIKELRDILKKLAHEDGAAVFVSSHLLSEMEMMCDRVGIISQGCLIAVKPIKELMAQAAGDMVYRFTVRSVEKALKIIASMEEIPSESIRESGERHFDVCVESEETIAQITAKLAGAGIGITGVAPLEKSLEDIFMEITGKGGNQIA
ncbi:MAG: ABC transporter ATP-binding protein [Oscillospiraceae bacterium]|jgi:ABC-2 type transport system ATP-binding protein|nr:ABC transporter ATP-binding protein [Oscillospiraceae bacterium]